jgi:hypothetical protein
MMLKFEKNSFAGRIMSLHDKKGVALALTLIRSVSSIYEREGTPSGHCNSLLLPRNGLFCLRGHEHVKNQ